MYKETTLTRKELYELVWTEPMTALAKKFQISETGLRKICIKMNIPLPKVGYWTKIKFGKKEKRIKLQMDYSGQHEITLSPTSEEVKEIYSKLTKQNILQKQIEEELGPMLIVAEKLTKPDKFITNTREYLNGFISYVDRINRNMQILKINVGKNSMTRTFRIMDTFIKALRQRGHDIVFRNGEPYVGVKGIEIKIYLKEKEKRVLNPKSKYSFDSHILVPTGILYLRIKENWRSKEFTDGKLLLEQQLSRIIAAIEIEADTEIAEEAEREIRRNEQEQKRLAALAIQQRKEKELFDYNELLEKANQFYKASLIRNYIKEIERRAREHNRFSNELSDWIEWASQKADWSDPTIQQGNAFE